jgi:hypothetical protein
VKDYVRAAKISGQEIFVPLTHAPGEAQAGLGEAVVVIAGVEQKAHYFVIGMGTAVYKAAKRMFAHPLQYLFENSGHYPAEEEPELFVERALFFLNTHLGW